MDKKGTKILLLGNNWKGTKRPQAYFIISGIRNIIGQEGTFVEKRKTLLLGMIEKEQKGLKLKLEGTLLGKIGTLMDEKGTKLFVRNIIAWEGTFMDKKGTSLC